MVLSQEELLHSLVAYNSSVKVRFQQHAAKLRELRLMGFMQSCPETCMCAVLLSRQTHVIVGFFWSFFAQIKLVLHKPESKEAVLIEKHKKG